MACNIIFPSIKKTLYFVKGKLLLDLRYLQEHVHPMTFSSLHAILQIGDEEMNVALECTSNQQGDEFYILEESLSCKYIVVVKDDALSSSHPITILDSPPYNTQSPCPLIDISTPIKEGNLNSSSSSTDSSILSFLGSMKKQNTITKILGKMQEVVKVKEIPRYYNDDLALEFPPTLGRHGGME